MSDMYIHTKINYISACEGISGEYFPEHYSNCSHNIYIRKLNKRAVDSRTSHPLLAQYEALGSPQAHWQGSQ